MPSGPRLMYRLAANEHTLPAARRLLAAGERVDQLDNQQLNALAHALQEGDHAAARRLLQLGARPATPIGGGNLPVALLPVMNRDLRGIRLMQQFGVDYATLRYQGMTALEHAKQTGDRALLEALDRRSSGA
jgi:ankyrin repeat protein